MADGPAPGAMTPPGRPTLVLPWPPLSAPDRGVLLRPWGASPGDAVALADAWADPEVARWNRVPDDHDVAAATRWIAGEAERRRRGLAMDLVITEPYRPDAVLGEVGLAMVDQRRRWAEVGYWMVPGARGQGRATVALSLFVDWVVTGLPVARLIARTNPANPSAGRVAAAAGFVAAGQLAEGPQVWVRDRRVGGTVDV